LELIAELGIHFFHFLFELVSLGERFVLFFDHFLLLLLEINSVCYHHILHSFRKKRNRQIFLPFLLEVGIFLLSHSFSLLSEQTIQLKIILPSFLHLLQFLYVILILSERLFIFVVVFQFGKWVFPYFLLNCFISNSTLVSAVFGLENPFGSWDVNVVAVLRISPDNKSLRALRTFHSEFIDFCCMEISYPCFDWVESHSLSYHVLTSFTANMKRCLVAYFRPSYSLTLNNRERFLVRGIALPYFHFIGIKVFGPIVAICSCCCQWTHFCDNYNRTAKSSYSCSLNDNWLYLKENCIIIIFLSSCFCSSSRYVFSRQLWLVRAVIFLDFRIDQKKEKEQYFWLT